MKKFIIAICLGILPVIFSNCKKDEAKEEVSNSSSHIGIWELRQAQSSMIPAIEYAPGNGDFLIFTDSLYKRYSAGQLVNSGRYFIIKDTSVRVETGLAIPSGQFTNRISFDSISSACKTFMEVSDNRLTLLSGYFPLDGGSKLSYDRQTSNR